VAPSGEVVDAVLDRPPFVGTAVGECIVARFRAARAPTHDAGLVKVGKSFALN